MLGAIIGDIVGSRFEWHNIKSKNFELFHRSCRFTDDTVMTLALCDALLKSCKDFTMLGRQAILSMQKFGRAYPDRGYGGNFSRWIWAQHPHPYGSWGNGSAMRVSSCAYAAHTSDQAKIFSRAVTEVTHNHPEGIKGAEAVAVALFMARTGSSLTEIREIINSHYYPMDFTLYSIRDSYQLDVSCQGSVPQAFAAFFESTDFEDAVRNAISIGGDSDTIAAIAGSLAEGYYGAPSHLREQALIFLDESLRSLVFAFEEVYPAKIEQI